MTVTLNPTDLAAALAVANKAAPSAAVQKRGKDLVWLNARYGQARLVWEETETRPGGSVTLAGETDGETKTPLTVTTALRRQIVETFPNIDRVTIIDGKMTAPRITETIRIEAGIEPGSRIPEIPAELSGEHLRLEAESFTAAAARVPKCATKDLARPLLREVEISRERGILRLTATDSYRLIALRVYQTEQETARNRIRGFLPADLLAAGGKIVDETAEIVWTDTRAEIVSGRTRLWMKRPARYSYNGASFPEWRQFRKERPKNGASLKDPAGTADRIRSYADAHPGCREIPITLTLGEDGDVTVRFRRRHPEGETEPEKVGEAANPTPAYVVLQTRYIVEGLKAADPRRQVKLSYEPDEKTGQILQAVYLEQGNPFFHLIMPVRT